MIYLDNSATTPLCQGAKRAITENLDTYGNPSSVHSMGVQARAAMSAARGKILSSLGYPQAKWIPDSLPYGAGSPDGVRLFFTSGGTEADNLAITGTLIAKNFKTKPHVITTDSEHPAMLETLSAASARGLCDLSLLSTRQGKIDLGELDSLITPNTLLVSIMAVNNETGAKYDIKSAFALAKRKNPNIITHTDAVQCWLKDTDRLCTTGADMITLSAHKIGAPKGVGALVVSNALLRSKRLVPIITGGGQEAAIRSGTENTLGIIAMGEAAAESYANLASNLSKWRDLRAVFANRLEEDGSASRINVADRYVPHIISLTLPNIKSEVMLRYLSMRDICVSAGSACSTHSKNKGSHVLRAFGLADGDIDSTIRISMGAQTCESDVIACADAIVDGERELAKIR